MADNDEEKAGPNPAYQQQPLAAPLLPQPPAAPLLGEAVTQERADAFGEYATQLLILRSAGLVPEALVLTAWRLAIRTQVQCAAMAGPEVILEEIKKLNTKLDGACAQLHNTDARRHNARVLSGGQATAATGLVALAKVATRAGNGDEARWDDLRQQLAATYSPVAQRQRKADEAMQPALGNTTFATVEIDVGQVADFGPFAPGTAATRDRLRQLSVANLLLLRLFYNDDFGIVDGDSHAVAVDKFLDWLQY